MTLKMPSSVSEGSRPPRSCLIFSYSSSVRPCCRSVSGVKAWAEKVLMEGTSIVAFLMGNGRENLETLWPGKGPNRQRRNPVVTVIRRNELRLYTRLGPPCVQGGPARELRWYWQPVT